MFRYLLLTLSFLTVQSQAAEKCTFLSSHKVIRESGSLLYYSWQELDRLVFESNVLPDTGEIAHFQDWVRSKVDPDQMTLLARQRKLYFEHFGSEAVYSFDLLLNKKAGDIQPISCLEALLLTEQAKLHPLEKTQTEFQAFVLLNKSVNPPQLKVYFASGTDLFAPSVLPFLPLIHSDVQNGWRVSFHVHNHPFTFDNPAGDIAGTTIPSGDRNSGDVKVFIDLRAQVGLLEARITNGFNTVHVKSGEFELFH